MLIDNRYKILFKEGETLNIKLNLSMGSIDFIDYREDIENELGIQQNSIINSIEDGEIVRFKADANSYKTTTLSFLYNGVPSYIQAGFIESEITTSQNSFKNSSYLFQIYDNYNSDAQTLLHSGYINGYQVLTTSTASTHTISLTSESFSVYLDETFIQLQTGNSFNLYFKFFFYKAKDGSLIQFTQNLPTLNSELQSYILIPFNLITRTYTFPSSLILKQLPNSDYINAVNSSVESIIIQKPTYPTGNTFNENGVYSQID